MWHSSIERFLMFGLFCNLHEEGKIKIYNIKFCQRKNIYSRFSKFNSGYFIHHVFILPQHSPDFFFSSKLLIKARDLNLDNKFRIISFTLIHSNVKMKVHEQKLTMHSISFKISNNLSSTRVLDRKFPSARVPINILS